MSKVDKRLVLWRKLLVVGVLVCGVIIGKDGVIMANSISHSIISPDYQER